MTVKELLLKLDSQEITEWMAYDLTTTDEWKEKNQKEAELEASRNMSEEDKVEAFKRLLGPK